jgi:ribosomal protein L37AE/L43A
MARNKVQFQKGLSEAAFETLYGTEAKCRAVVIASRWPNGFECPLCGGRTYCEVMSRGLFQCSSCRRQTSPIAGTIFASTHLPLRLWFRAMYHLTQSKQGISSIELGRRLGVTQTTAWKIKHRCCYRSRVFASGRQNWLRPCRGAHLDLQMGQHGAGQYQGRNRWNLPGDRTEARAALPRRVRVSFQSPIRSGRDDAAPRVVFRSNPADALQAAQMAEIYP